MSGHWSAWEYEFVVICAIYVLAVFGLGNVLFWAWVGFIALRSQYWLWRMRRSK